MGVYKRPLVVLCCVVLLLNGCAHARRGPSQRTDWSKVLALPPDTVIEIVTTDGRRRSGPLASADAHQVTMKPLALTILRSDVVSVWSLGKSQSLTKGYVAGAIAGILIGSSTQAEGPRAVIAPVMGVAIGSVIGAWLTNRGHVQKRALVYSRP